MFKLRRPTRLFKSDPRQSTRQPLSVIWASILTTFMLSMKHHVAKVAAVCFYHLRRLRQIRRRISTEVTNRLVLAVVISRLDYCNSVSAGVMARTIGTSITRTECCKSLIFELTPRDHISPSLLQLHWLPVQYADASSISCAALCTLYTPQDARLI